MPVALVLDFADGTKAQYDDVCARLELGGRMPPGGILHAAGGFAGGWRVVDVWDDPASFERFRAAALAPHAASAGLAPPEVRVVPAHRELPGSGDVPALVQVVTLPGVDGATFDALNDRILRAGPLPDALTFHISGPVPEGWCVVDGWASAAARDRFRSERVEPVVAAGPMAAAPVIKDLHVEATLAAAASVAA
jgi:hypothetical protein